MMNTLSEHKLLITDQTERFTEWECPICDRQLRIGNKGELEILNKGDQTVVHRADMGQTLLSLKNTNIQSHTLH